MQQSTFQKSKIAFSGVVGGCGLKIY